MIDQTTIDTIMNTADIVEVIGDFVTLKKRGVNYIGLCPFHDEKTPSFTVSPAKGIFKCFGCGKGGNVVHFLMEHEQVNYYEALKWLAKKYGITIVEKELTDKQKQVYNRRESLFIVNNFARDFFINSLFNTDEGLSVGMSYFKERSFRNETIKKFQLGYSPVKKNSFSEEALKNGFNKDYLIETGLSLQYNDGNLYDRYRERVIFPIHSLSGKVIAFGGRILKNNEKSAKYINSPESEIYHKSNELYGLYFARNAITKYDKCYLVEGYADVISMHQSGIENVVASSGTALTQGQIRLIRRFTQNVTVLYDGDSAGIKASLKGIDLLLEQGLNVKVMLLPDGEDPDSFARKMSSSDFKEYIKNNETDFIKFKTEILLKDSENDPVAKSKIIQNIVGSISLVSNNITRSLYIDECGKILNFDTEIIEKEVNKKRNFTKKYNYDHPEEFGPEPPVNEAEKDIPRKPTQSKRKNPLDNFEKNIIRYIIKYGNKIFCTDDNNNDITVTMFINYDLERDEIEIQNPIYKKILKTAVEKTDKGETFNESFFVNNNDNEISSVSSNILSEELRIDLKILNETEKEEDNLIKHVPRALMELKYEINKIEMAQTQKELKDRAKEKNEEKIRDVIKRLIALREQRKELATHLGERIVVK